MSWLDDLKSKGKALLNESCDPPWTVDWDWPLKSRPPNLFSTVAGNEGAPSDGSDPMVPLGELCPDWYTREFKHVSPSTGEWTSVSKYWNKMTNKTTWVCPSYPVATMKVQFPELYALLAPLPENIKIEDDPDFSGKGEGDLTKDLEDYVKEVGSKDPEVPAEVKKAGIPWWGILLGLGVIGGIVVAARKRKKKKKGKKLKKYRPAWELP